MSNEWELWHSDSSIVFLMLAVYFDTVIGESFVVFVLNIFIIGERRFTQIGWTI